MKRVVIALLVPVTWSPPGIDLNRWRAALAEDVVDLLARLAQADPAIAASAGDQDLAKSIAWPGTPIYEVPTTTIHPALEAAATAGYDQAAVVAADAADVPGMILGKLLRPLSTKPVAVASAGPSGGLLGLATHLPTPTWLPDVSLDIASPAQLRRLAPQPSMIESTAGWRRLRGPADLAQIDLKLEGWETTRSLLGG